jgi:CelD/BcsL family acetyltransferase involved in cellulose biosynthesis
MTMAAVMGHNSARTDAMSPAIAHVEVFNRLSDAEAIWRGMETPDHRFTPFQSFNFVSAWQTEVGEREDVRPYIVAFFDAERRPLMLLPLGVRHENGARVASFFGDKHSTFNMPLLARDFATLAGKPDIAAAIDLLRTCPDRPDLLALARQPHRWVDIANPIALLPTRESVNVCPVLTLEPGAAPADRISNSFRRRLKGKERKLQALAGYRYFVPETDADIARILEAFFAIKPQRMAAAKLPDVFVDPGVRDFIFKACLARQPDGAPTIVIHALECDEEVIAIFAGVADGHRFSMMFNTYTMSENAKFSPGLILLRYIIDSYADSGYGKLDLGIGSDEYKRLFCKDDEPIFDSFLPLTLKGSIAALGLSSLTFAKRFVKRTPALAQMAQALRGALHG